MHDYLLVVGILVSALGNQDYEIREAATEVLSAYNNKYDYRHFLLMYTKHPDAEIRMRIQKVFTNYYQPYPSVSPNLLPPITAYNGQYDSEWREAFALAYSSISEEGEEGQYLGWVLADDPRLATRSFIWSLQNRGLSRSDVIHILNMMTVNEWLWLHYPNKSY
jgi:hypothetical protein